MGGCGVGVEVGQTVGVEELGWGFRLTLSPAAGAAACTAVAVGPDCLVLAAEGGGTLRIPLYLVRAVRRAGDPPQAA